jgi:hypothetical protein
MIVAERNCDPGGSCVSGVRTRFSVMLSFSFTFKNR